MKKNLFTAALFFFAASCTFQVQAQSFERQGNTFTAVKSTSKKEKAQPTRTKYTWKDSKGVEYPIYVSSTGSCFVFRTSSKTGNEYKQYMSKEISAQICKEMGIEYKPKK